MLIQCFVYNLQRGIQLTDIRFGPTVQFYAFFCEPRKHEQGICILIVRAVFRYISVIAPGFQVWIEGLGIVFLHGTGCVSFHQFPVISGRAIIPL